MKNIIKYSLAVLMLGLVNATYGQPNPNPDPTDPINIESKDYYQHGYNKSGQDLLREERDSVTVTSVVKYFVLPDPKVSPGYDIGTPTNFSQVSSTFAWSLANSLGNAVGATPLVTVTWGNVTGIDSVKVKETPNAGGACAGNGTSIPVAVIAKPEIGFTAKGSLYSDSACYTQAQVNAKINLPFATTGTTSSSQVWVDYMVTKDGGGPSVVTDVLVKNETIPLEFDDYGRYVITITKVTDRVSRKSDVVGDITAAGAKFTYNVMKPVQTGPIYRVPNNY